MHHRNQNCTFIKLRQYIQLYTIIPNSEHIIILFKMYIEILLNNEYLIIKKSK